MSKITATEKNTIRLFSFGQYLIPFVSIDKSAAGRMIVDQFGKVSTHVGGKTLTEAHHRFYIRAIWDSRNMSAHILNAAIAENKNPGFVRKVRVPVRRNFC